MHAGRWGLTYGAPDDERIAVGAEPAMSVERRIAAASLKSPPSAGSDGPPCPLVRHGKELSSCLPGGLAGACCAGLAKAADSALLDMAETGLGLPTRQHC